MEHCSSVKISKVFRVKCIPGQVVSTFKPSYFTVLSTESTVKPLAFAIRGSCFYSIVCGEQVIIVDT